VLVSAWVQTFYLGSKQNHVQLEKQGSALLPDCDLCSAQGSSADVHFTCCRGIAFHRLGDGISQTFAYA